MKETETDADHCPHCGAELLSGTTDFAEVSDETTDIDEPRTEFVPGQMMQSVTCPTPGCPGPDAGARV